MAPTSANLRARGLSSAPQDTQASEPAPIYDDAAMELGQLYRSSAVAISDAALPPAARPDEWRGQPGTRAPHLWVTRGSERVSTLDLFQRSWVLLADAPEWLESATAATAAVGVTVESIDTSSLVEAQALRTAFGIERGGASLVRPDGYVAWRARELPAHPTQTLCAALRSFCA